MCKNAIQVDLSQLWDGACALIGFKGSTVAKFLCDYRTDSGVGGIEGPGKGHGTGKNMADKFFLTGMEGIQFFLGIGNKIVPAGKYLSDRTGLGGNVFDAVDDGVLLITKDKIAVFSHQFQDQLFFPEIPKIIIVFDLKVDDPLQARLPDPGDLSVSDMLAQKHTEIRGSQRPLFVGFCSINKGKAGTGGHEQADLSSVAAFKGDQQFIIFRLCNLVDAGVRKKNG